MKRSLLLFSLLVLSSLLPALAQENKRLSREAIDSVKNRKLLEDCGTVLKFSEYTHDMGVIFENDTTFVFEFAFTNISKETIVITDIATNCGCTSSFCSKKEVNPGEDGVVTVKFNPRHRSGTVDTNVFVYTTLSANKPVAKLTLLGSIIDRNEWRHLPVAMGSLRLKSKKIVFEQVKKSTVPQMRVACANIGTAPLRLTSNLLPEFASFGTDPVELAPGEEGDIVVAIDSNLLPFQGCEGFRILVDGVEGRVSDRMLEIKIKNIKE